MANQYLDQYTGDGTITSFVTTFKIAQNGLLNVYITLSGATASEVNDIVSATDYSVTYTDTTASNTTATVVFNTAPASGSIITIAPKGNADVTVDFTSTQLLTLSDLNLAYSQQATPTNFSLDLFNNNSLRYNVNINQSEASAYSLLLPLLSDGGFWRRSGASIISQDYTTLVTDVTNSITNFSNENEEITISNQTGTTFSISGFITGEATQDTVFVYKNGLKLSQTSDYTINSTAQTITFNTALVVSDTVYLNKPAVKESSLFLDIDASNITSNGVTNIQNSLLTAEQGASLPSSSFTILASENKRDFYINNLTSAITVTLPSLSSVVDNFSVECVIPSNNNTVTFATDGTNQFFHNEALSTSVDVNLNNARVKIQRLTNTLWALQFTDQAVEGRVGVAEIATQTETDTGTNDTKIVTPLKLATSPWGFNLKIWNGNSSTIFNQSLGNVSQSYNLDLTAVNMIDGTGATVVTDLSSKRAIYYSIVVSDTSSSGTAGITTINRNSSNGILLCSSASFSSGSNADSVETTTLFLDVTGSNETIFINRSGQRSSSDVIIYVTGWVE